MDEAIKVAKCLSDFYSNYIKAKENQNNVVAAKVDQGNKGKDKFVPKIGRNSKVNATIPHFSIRTTKKRRRG